MGWQAPWWQVSDDNSVKSREEVLGREGRKGMGVGLH